MLDDLDALRSRDPRSFLARLHALPDRPDVPDGALGEGVRLRAAPSAAALAAALAPWLDPSGAEAVTIALAWGPGADDAAGADVVLTTADDPDRDEARVVALPAEAFAPYHVARYVAFATGRAEAGERLAAALREIAAAAHPSIPTEANPAKRLAWALWQRVPLLIGDVPAQLLVQQTFALVGKTFAVPAGAAPTLIAATAFEGRHALADDLVALWLAPDEGPLAEILASRVAQSEELRHGTAWLGAASGDAAIDALTLWYAATWVAAYGALLAEIDPGAASVYERAVAGG